MPVVLNNACINRVQKVLKLKLTSSDLTAMKALPFFLFRAKDGQKASYVSSIFLALPSGHGYRGSLYFSSVGSIPQATFSFVDGNVFDGISVGPTGGDGENCFLSVDPDFEIGVVRPDIEIHIYYFSESCSVAYDTNYVPYEE